MRGADLLAALDPAPRRHHAFGIDFAAGEGGRHAVGEEDDRIDRVFVDALLRRTGRSRSARAGRRTRAGSSRPARAARSRRGCGRVRPAIAPDLEQDAVADEDARCSATSVSRTPSNNCPPVMTMSPASMAGMFWVWRLPRRPRHEQDRRSAQSLRGHAPSEREAREEQRTGETTSAESMSAVVLQSSRHRRAAHGAAVRESCTGGGVHGRSGRVAWLADRAGRPRRGGGRLTTPAVRPTPRAVRLAARVAGARGRAWRARPRAGCSPRSCAAAAAHGALARERALAPPLAALVRRGRRRRRPRRRRRRRSTATCARTPPSSRAASGC